eukprot:15133972-Alexandrium_andersonii.AAC.1
MAPPRGAGPPAKSVRAGAEQRSGAASSAAAEVRVRGRRGRVGFHSAGGPELAAPARPFATQYLFSQ